jgi:hypothetical protein
MNNFYRTTGLALSIAIPGWLQAQTTVVKEAQTEKGTIVVIPGKEYKRSGFHNFFWGKHYRKEWTTQVRVNDLYLDTALGGLTPTETGGSRQSKTLRLRAKNGKEYVLRSINKDFGRALPEDAKNSFARKIAKDQSSIGHPFSSITIPPMAKAAGIYYTDPIIVFVPHQSALGEFDKEYGDELYALEARPDDNQEDAANFGYSKNLVSTDKILERVYEDNDNQVDQAAFVRARLFDMIIGDWGRHPDNWRWAKFDSGKLNIYKPVPRDRDQAYTKIDGLYPSLAGKVYKPFQGFHKNIKGVSSWNKHALPVDRLFLTGLEKEEWIQQAAYLQKTLTDSVISSSIRLMPAEEFAVSGNEIIEILRSRRDHIVEYAETYYKYLARYPDLTGSQDKEYFTVTRLPHNETEITIQKITKEGVIVPEPFYSRRFSRKEAKEVRIYSLEEDDVVELKGGHTRGVKVRIIDPGGDDSIVYREKYLHNRVDVSSGKKFKYDTTHAKRIDFTLRPIISSSIYKVFDRNPLKIFPRTGLKVLASLTYIPQPWRKEEYQMINHICANYGFLRNAFNVGYIGDFGRLIGKWDFVIKARLDAPAVENYFGTGNNTELVNKARHYYQTYSERAFGSIGLERDFGKNHVEISGVFQSIKVHHRGIHYISDGASQVDPSVFERKNFAGAQAGYYYMDFDNDVFPVKGFGFSAGVGYTTNIDNHDSFVKGIVGTTVFVPFGPFSIAVRAGGGALSGTADYYNLNTIGGGGSGELRGYDRERFYGKESFYLNNELRWLFRTRNYVYGGKMGLMAFYDMGRVWMPGEKSNALHGSYGGGVIFIPYNKFALTVTYGVSSEATHINFKTGFFF